MRPAKRNPHRDEETEAVASSSTASSSRRPFIDLETAGADGSTGVKE